MEQLQCKRVSKPVYSLLLTRVADYFSPSSCLLSFILFFYPILSNARGNDHTECTQFSFSWHLWLGLKIKIP